MNFNGDSQGSFLGGQKLGIFATQKLFLHHGEGGGGGGAVCRSLKRYLHSQKDVDAKYLNAAQCDRLERLLVVDQGVIKVNHKDQVFISFLHNELPN